VTYNLYFATLVSAVKTNAMRKRFRKEIYNMPLYMDIHHIAEGVTEEAVAEAHFKDLGTQSKYGVNYMKYWVDKINGTIFCLVEAPNKEAAERVHREAHGLVADEIFEVSEHS
jgi:hypothetical protein